MAKVFKKDDRIKVQIEDVTFWLAPLTYEQKKQIMSPMTRKDTTQLDGGMEMIKQAVKMSVKKAEGLEDDNGVYQLRFDEKTGYMTDECVDDLANIPSIGKKLTSIAMDVTSGNISEEPKDEAGRVLEGVTVFFRNRQETQRIKGPALIEVLYQETMAISGLTMELHVKLMATYAAQHNPRYDCHKCLEKTPSKTIRKSWGCFGGKGVVKILGDYQLTSCPGNFYDETAVFMIELYHLFERGHLPFPGSLTEQPAQIIEAFGVIQGLDNKRQELEQKRANNGR